MGVADRQKLIADAGKKESWRKEEVKRGSDLDAHTVTSDWAREHAAAVEEAKAKAIADAAAAVAAAEEAAAAAAAAAEAERQAAIAAAAQEQREREE
eukprot:6816-Heterococcus_DN1.PRE.2